MYTLISFTVTEKEAAVKINEELSPNWRIGSIDQKVQGNSPKKMQNPAKHCSDE